MLHNITNFLTLVSKGGLKKSLTETDLLTFGRKSGKSIQGYEPMAIQYKDLVEDISNQLPNSVPADNSTLEVVDMTAAQIIAANDGASGEFELLAAPAAGTYREYESITFEYTHVGTDYVGAGGADGLFVNVGGFTIGVINDNLFDSSADRVAIIVSGSPSDATQPHITKGLPVGGSLGVLYSNLAGLTTGDGTLKIKVRYRLRTFG